MKPELAQSLKYNVKFRRAYFVDATVQSMLKDEKALEDVIAALFEQKEAMMQKIASLESIAPKRIKMPDGKFMVWHCPDELIPATEID